MRLPWILVTSLAVFPACSSDDEEPEKLTKGGSCDPSGENVEAQCADGLSCEAVGGQPDAFVCGEPVEIRGRVFDALDDGSLPEARVIAFDPGGAPISDVAISDAEGNYTLEVPSPRDTNGEVVAGTTYTLGCTREDYIPYPSGVRPAIPVSVDDIMAETSGDTDGSSTTGVIQNAATDIAMIPGSTDGVTISGTVLPEGGAGALVVAEGTATPAPFAVADRSGSYAIYNVPAGAVTVRGYRGGISLNPEAVMVASDDLTVDLDGDGAGLSAVRGSVNIVNAPGGSETSVVLVPSSVYLDTLERGPVPLGLRAPEPGLPVSINSAFEIPGVPAGTYKVLAAFENDQLVRDPDESIAGTAIVEITVEPGVDIDVPDSFKVTEALAIVGPGADAPEEVTGTPQFVFEDDSSESRYIVVLFNALGELVWERTDVVAAGDPVMVDYDGPALEAGMYYQFRATSVKDSPQGATNISRTEDLRGVFVFGG